MVRNLMNDGLAYLASDCLGTCVADLFDNRFPEQRDAIWGDQVVTARPIHAIDAFVEAEQVVRRIIASAFDAFRARSFLDHHGDVLETLPDIRGQLIERFGDECFERLQGRARRTASPCCRVPGKSLGPVIHRPSGSTASSMLTATSRPTMT
jgi:hypothetical protein